MTGFIFCHGWSMQPSFFYELAAALSLSECIHWDRGYAGERNCPHPTSSEKEWVGIGHSQGFNHLAQSGFPFKGLIGLSAFSHFLGRDPELASQRAPILTGFQQNFRRSPKETIADFWKNGQLDACPFEPNIANLEEDLNRLGSRVSVMPSIPTLIISAKGDPIVPPDLIQDNFKEIETVEIILLPTSGHGLPAPIPELKAYIEDFVNSL
jgi:pimeloyl-ACP methyl ester carboxylesterase